VFFLGGGGGSSSLFGRSLTVVRNLGRVVGGRLKGFWKIFDGRSQDVGRVFEGCLEGF